jgi:hypothetical protein
VHGCNAQGKMRSDVAKSIREKFPEAYEVYAGHILYHKVNCKPVMGTICGLETKKQDHQQCNHARILWILPEEICVI